MPAVGELRYKVDLIEPRENRPRQSGFVESEWRPWLSQTPAAIVFDSESESGGERGRTGSKTATVTIRNALPRAVTTRDAVLWRGRLLGIESAIVTPDERWTVLTVREGS